MSSMQETSSVPGKDEWREYYVVIKATDQIHIGTVLRCNWLEELEGAVQQGSSTVQEVLNDLSAEEKGKGFSVNDECEHFVKTKEKPSKDTTLPEWSRIHTESNSNRGLKRSQTLISWNKAMVQDGKVVVQDVRGRYNANNQGRPFQRNNARGNGVAGNVGGQNRGGMINPGQAKPIKCYNCND
ncbi:hypothetical protein Tco_0666556 [Tanacetum coccineum]